MKKVSGFLGCLLPIIAAIVCQYAVTFGVSIVYGFILVVKAIVAGASEEMQQNMISTALDGDALLIITAIATFATLIMGAVWYRRHKPVNDLTLKQVVNPALLASMVMLGLSLQFLVSMCLNMVYPLLPQNLTDQYSELMETLMGGNVWLSLFVTVILAPLAEEFLFRGVTLKKAQKFMPFLAANVLQAVLFGIYHMNLIQGVYAFVLGLILGFTAEYFHSIWASVLLHAFVNGSAEVLSYLPEAVTDTYAGVIGIAVTGVILLFAAAKLYPKAKTEIAVEEKEKFSEISFDE